MLFLPSITNYTGRYMMGFSKMNHSLLMFSVNPFLISILFSFLFVSSKTTFVLKFVMCKENLGR